MKLRVYTDLICRKFCEFFSEGKEDLHCGAYEFIGRHLSPEELEEMIPGIGRADFSYDQQIRSGVCLQCAFLVDGCDFRDGLESPPCGGYPVLEHLLKTGKIGPDA